MALCYLQLDQIPRHGKVYGPQLPILTILPNIYAPPILTSKTTKPLSSYIGPDTNSESSTLFLSGTAPPDDILSLLQPETVALLHMTAQPHLAPQKGVSIEMPLSPATRQLLKVPPPPSHFGHYKAALQYGSRKGCQCVSTILKKQLTHDIILHKKSVAAFLENDAQWCYDRMLNNILLLELQHLGMPKTAITTLHDTWANACHHIKTKFGISTKSLQISLECPLFGPGRATPWDPFSGWSYYTNCQISKPPACPHNTNIDK